MEKEFFRLHDTKKIIVAAEKPEEEKQQLLSKQVEQLKELRDKFQRRNEADLLAPDEIKAQLADLEKSPDFEKLYRGVIERIQEETNYFQDLGEIGLYADLVKALSATV